MNILLHLEARRILGMNQRTLGEKLGISARTVQRWDAKQSVPASFHWHALALAVHAIDPTLAERLAVAGGSSLKALGLANDATAHAPSHLADAVVCAAAESIDVSPRAIRTALLAAFRRAKQMRLTMDDLETALATETPSRKEPKKKG